MFDFILLYARAKYICRAYRVCPVHPYNVPYGRFWFPSINLRVQLEGPEIFCEQH
jgi:hypothetical protein